MPALIFACVPAFVLGANFNYIYPKQLLFQSVVVMATVLWLRKQNRTGVELNASNSRLLGVLLFFLFVTASSLAYSSHPLATAHRFSEFLFSVVWVVGLSSLCKITFKRLHFAVVTGGVLASLLGLGYLYQRGIPRLMWPLGNPNIFGAYLIAPLASVAYALAVDIKMRRYRTLWLYAGGLCILSSAFIKCRSQSATLAVVVPAVVFLWAWLCSGRARLFYGGLVTALLILFVAASSDDFLAYLRMARAVRYTTLEAAIAMLKEAPLLGHGAGTYSGLFSSFAAADWQLLPGFGYILNTAHNEYAEIAAGLGFIGLTLFLFIILWPLYIFYRRPVKEALPFCFTHAAWVISIGLSGAMRYEFFPIVFWTNYAVLLNALGGGCSYSISLRSVALRRTVMAVGMVFVALASLLVWRSGVAHYHYYRAGQLESRGEIAVAAEHLELAKNRVNSLHKESLLRWRLFNHYQRLGRDDRALATAQELNALSPHYVNISKQIPQMDLTRDNLAERLVPLLQEMFRDYHNHFYRKRLVPLLRQQRDLTAVLPHFSTAQQIFIKLLVATEGRGELIAELRAQPDRPPASEMVIADAAMAISDFNEARRLYAAEIERYPYSSQGWVGLIGVALRQNSGAQAHLLLTKLREARIERLNPSLQRFMADTYLTIRQWQEAYDLYKKLINEGDTAAPVILGIAQASLSLGKNLEAQAHIVRLQKRHGSQLSAAQRRWAAAILEGADTL